MVKAKSSTLRGPPPPPRAAPAGGWRGGCAAPGYPKSWFCRWLFRLARGDRCADEMDAHQQNQDYALVGPEGPCASGLRPFCVPRRGDGRRRSRTLPVGQLLFALCLAAPAAPLPRRGSGLATRTTRRTIYHTSRIPTDQPITPIGFHPSCAAFVRIARLFPDVFISASRALQQGAQAVQSMRV
jgi:hypothetical protein